MEVKKGSYQMHLYLVQVVCYLRAKCRQGSRMSESSLALRWSYPETSPMRNYERMVTYSPNPERTPITTPVTDHGYQALPSSLPSLTKPRGVGDEVRPPDYG